MYMQSDKISENIKQEQEKNKKQEYQYLNLINQVLNNGFWEEGRNGKTKSIFGNMMRYSLEDNTIPILTTKKTAWKTCLKELLWFISGETNNTILKNQGVHIWDANGTREYLDSRELYDYPEDILGPIYGRQWRSFNANYNLDQNQPQNTGINQLQNTGIDQLQNTGIDQLQQIIDALKDPVQRTSRRLVMTAWNPCQLDQMALPPCHILCQFNVHDGNKLSCTMYQRSVDTMLGLPFNIASYSFLTHLLAKHCGLEAYEFIHFMGNIHIYEDHIESAKLQITREPFDFPKVNIKTIKNDINDYTIDDFEILDYKCHEMINIKIIA